MSEGTHGSHNAGVAGSSPAPAMAGGEAHTAPDGSTQLALWSGDTPVPPCATLPAALAALTQAAPGQGSKGGSIPRAWAPAVTAHANVALTRRPGDWAWCLFRVHRDGTWRITRTIYAPTKGDALRYFGRLREDQGVASALSLQTSGRLPLQPRSERGDDLEGHANPVKVSGALVHPDRRNGRKVAIPDRRGVVHPPRTRERAS